MKIYRVVFVIALLLSMLLPGCGKSAPESEGNIDNTAYEVSETNEMTSAAVYEFPVIVSDNHELTISLQLAEPEGQYTKEVEIVQIYDGDRLLQTITKEDIPYVTDYAWDGLFLNEGNQVGMPDVRDLNFDGAEDFGLLAVSAYPHNVPYSYFFWNAEKELFEYQFTAFGPGWLQVNESEKCLVEVSTAGSETYEKCFTFDQDGNMVSGNQTGSGFETIQDTDKHILLQVLQNQAQYYSMSNDELRTLSGYCTNESNRLGFEVSITRYAFVDMDGDGTQEAIVDFRFGENSQVMCMVLKWDSISENIFGMGFYYRQMYQIKEDGNFAYSGGGDNDGWAKLRWENNTWVTEDVEDSDQKADIQWYSYPKTPN